MKREVGRTGGRRRVRDALRIRVAGLGGRTRVEVRRRDWRRVFSAADQRARV